MSAILSVENLTKRYGQEVAVDNVSFEVERGEIFGLLGPNGAGKTTTLNIIEGLKHPDSGNVSILGVDVRRHATAIKQHIGVQLQTTSLMPELSAVEQLQLFAHLYRRWISRETALKLLHQVGLSDKANYQPGKLSGGQQQRLALALVLINDPQIIFLDEPTAGLDTQSRRNLWELIRDLRDKGRTIILTTHYMEEAEALCDRIGIMNKGRLLALDTTKGLIARYGKDATIVTDTSLPDDVVQMLPDVTHVTRNGALHIQTRNPSRTTSALLQLTQAKQLAMTNYEVIHPSLEDVFISLTGESYEPHLTE